MVETSWVKWVARWKTSEEDRVDEDRDDKTENEANGGLQCSMIIILFLLLRQAVSA